MRWNQRLTVRKRSDDKLGRLLALNVSSLRCRNLSGVGGRLVLDAARNWSGSRARWNLFRRGLRARRRHRRRLEMLRFSDLGAVAARRKGCLRRLFLNSPAKRAISPSVSRQALTGTTRTLFAARAREGFQLFHLFPPPLAGGGGRRQAKRPNSSPVLRHRA
jgi:hypothetical protein